MSSTIVVIDDSPVVRSQVNDVLSQGGYNVLMAEDGKQGVELVQAHGTAISLIICDMRMPKMDGMEVLRWLSESAFRSIPFVMLTTEGSHRFVSEARNLGAKGWVVKPFNDDMLLMAVKRLVRAPRLSAVGR